MARKIIEVEEEEPKKSKKKLDLNKIVEVISENKDTIEMVAGTLLSSQKSKKKTSTKKSTKSKTSSKKKSVDNDTLANAFDLVGSLLKK